MASRPFQYRWRWRLAASPEALWPLVADTNRFNRDTRLPPIEDVRDGASIANARRRLRFRLAGIATEWEETPFEWVQPRRFAVVRRYARGALREMRVRVELEEAGPSATELTYDVSAWPRGAAGRLAIPLGIGVLSRLSFGRVFRRYEREALAAEERRLAPAPRAADTRLAGRARERASRLETAGVDVGAARALVAHLELGDDLSLARMRPYALARLWGLGRRQVLAAFLHGTRQGLLNLRWDVICPLCLGARESADGLARLRAGRAHCDTCLVDFETDFARSVEVTFTPNPSVRQVPSAAFCVAGPRVTPHVVVQQLLDAGERRSLDARLEPGRYRARTLDASAASPFTVAEEEADGAAPLEVRLDEGQLTTSPSTIAPRARLTLANDTAREHLVLVERTDWGEDALTAAELTSLQEFRDLFAAETLHSGDVVSVGTLTVLFTDLRGSTGLYSAIGDAYAFARVMDHFAVLREAILPEEGALVKTIGDAVMAVFLSPAAAVRAALGAQAALERRARGAGYEPLVLKAGIHVGPCIAVTLDDRLDYFGSTVNVASRLGELSGGGDLVLSGDVFDDAGVRALVEARGARATRLDVRLRGLEDAAVSVWRVAIPRA